MYKRLSAVLFPVMTLLFIGSIYWGYQEHQEKNSILIRAENQYQRAFHDLSYHVEALHKQLGNTLAVSANSQGFHRKGLINVWRLTSEAQNEVNQLPLNLLPFNKTEEFLSRIANFSYKTAVRDLTKQPLTDDEFKTLKALYDSSKEISKDLRAMQQKVISNSLRWMDVESALAQERAATDNTLIDGFRSVDKKVGDYPEINWGPSVSMMYQRRTVNMLSGGNATPEEIRQKAAKFLGVPADVVRVVENAKGTEYESYTAMAGESAAGNLVQLEYTRRGGQLISYFNPREIGKKQIDLKEARANADEFLEKHDYPDMVAVNYDDYGDSGTFTYVATQNGVLLYPEKLTVKVALDNGEPVSLQAADFVYEHHKRKLPKPKMSEAEARKALNPGFKVSINRKSLITNEMGDEVLCYEYEGRINGGYYRVFINADSGIEEAVEQLPEGGGTAASAR